MVSVTPAGRTKLHPGISPQRARVDPTGGIGQAGRSCRTGRSTDALQPRRLSSSAGWRFRTISRQLAATASKDSGSLSRPCSSKPLTSPGNTSSACSLGVSSVYPTYMTGRSSPPRTACIKLLVPDQQQPTISTRAQIPRHAARPPRASSSIIPGLSKWPSTSASPSAREIAAPRTYGLASSTTVGSFAPTCRRAVFSRLAMSGSPTGGGAPLHTNARVVPTSPILPARVSPPDQDERARVPVQRRD
jgi:hypothetical protein